MDETFVQLVNQTVEGLHEGDMFKQLSLQTLCICCVGADNIGCASAGEMFIMDVYDSASEIRMEVYLEWVFGGGDAVRCNKFV